MDFYFNISMDSTYARKYSTLMCFHLNTIKLVFSTNFQYIYIYYNL